MVDEFSSFARMPAPVLKPEDLATIVERAVFLQRTAHPEIAFETQLRDAPGAAALRCAPGRPGADQHRQERDRVDRRPNRRKRAEPARPYRRDGRGGRRRLRSRSRTTAKACRQHGRERLTEPYVTTRAKGTGLGLAIVKKIMEDHSGELVLEDRAARRGSGETGICRRGAGRAPFAAHEAPAELSAVGHGA